MRLSVSRSCTRLLIEFSRTLTGITMRRTFPPSAVAIIPVCTLDFSSSHRRFSRPHREPRTYLSPCNPCGVDGTEEGRRGLPLLRQHRGRGDPAHGRLARDRRHGPDPRSDDERRADRGLAADRTRDGLDRRRGPGSRHEGARPRAREGLRLQARAVDRTGAAEGDPEGPRQENAREESTREEGSREEAEAETQEVEGQKGEGQEIQAG